jgi:hypothetical protein
MDLLLIGIVAVRDWTEVYFLMTTANPMGKSAGDASAFPAAA